MVAPNNQCLCAVHFLVLSYSQNGHSKDFLVYGRDPGGFLVVLVLNHCVNTTEAKIKMGMKLTQVWGAKLKVSLQLSPSRIVCCY